MSRNNFMRTYWMPLTVLLLGLVSVILLVWTDRMKDKQRMNYATVDAVMDVQIHASAFHLWFEEYLAADADDVEQTKNIWKDFAQADGLTHALLAGGESEHGVVLQPLKDPEQRAFAEEIRSRLAELQTIAVARQQDAAHAGIGSELDRQFDWIFGVLLEKSSALDRVLQTEKERNEKRLRRLSFEIIFVWTLIVTVAVLGLLNRERRRKASEEALLVAHAKLVAQAAELNEHRLHLTELVDTRTREVTATNENLELEIEQHRRTEEALVESQKQLRQISSRLLSAQEAERRRIARELHDELGQSLTLMKLQLRSIERQLRDDQVSLKTECADILTYMNTVIEDVRRLSKDLCPIILEDLGLTRALRWLVDNFAKNNAEIRITHDMEDIDHLFSPNDQTGIYRIVQEALTNIVKHSRARNASITIRSEHDCVLFSINDDGKGFDTARTVAENVSGDRGLGLAGMEERVSMLGGTLTLTSEPDKYTRLVFSLPSKQGKERNELISHNTCR